MSENKNIDNKQEKENLEQSQPAKRWYVLRAISGKEKKVKEYIDLELSRNKELAQYISQVLIPTEKVIEFRKGKKIVKERNFYPGYVLVEAALVGEVPHFLRNVPNVISFVGEDKGKKPVPLREDEVKRILGYADKLQESDEALEQEFQVGETVKVIDGPFNGFVGVIEQVNNERKKLKVVVKIFERRTPIELRFNQVEKED